MRAHFATALLLLACGKGAADIGGPKRPLGAAGASGGGAAGKAGASSTVPDEPAGAAGDQASGTGGSTGRGGSTSTGTGGSSGTRGSSGHVGESGSSSGPTVSFGSFQRADVVIGQSDFTSNGKPAKVGAAVTDYTAGSAAFDGKRLFLTDAYDGRVLGFGSVPQQNGASADLVLGQAKLSSSNPGATLAGLFLPQSVHTDGTTLAIADAGNHRVLLVPTSAATGDAATVLIGWPDALTPRSGCSAVLLRSPSSAFIAKGKLLVADRGNHRVLVWNRVPAHAGVPADLVLGQTTFTSCVPNDASHSSTVGLREADTMKGPTDVWTDGKRVLVADRDNNRVLLWSKFPTDSGAPADIVIGQAGFEVARNDAAPNVLLRPSAVAYDGEELVVADSGHNRVLGWAGLPTENGTDAEFVLGQKDFTHVAANDDAQKGKDGSAPTSRTLALPTGVAFTDDALVVSDTLNRRALVFQRR